MKKILSLLIAFLTLQLNAQTTIPGGYIHGNWTLAGSPYLIQGSVMVPNDSTLTIQAGVTVNFQGHYKLLVGGRLLAMGTATDSIHFTASNTTTGWYGIRFDTTHTTNDTSKFFYCSVKYGIANGTGVDQYGGGFMLNGFSNVIISNCSIKNCFPLYYGYGYGSSGGGIYLVNSSPIIKNNSIQYCGGGISAGGSCNPIISNNVVSYNNGSGITGGDVNSIIYNNIVSHNAQLGISGRGTISYNTVSYNNTSQDNSSCGGISLGSISPQLVSHNIVTYNYSSNTGYAAGIFCYECLNLTISDNIIANNTGVNGAGIQAVCSYNTGNSPIITNNVIANNTALSSGSNSGEGGGICIWGGTAIPQITNNTIVNNNASIGGGIYISGAESPSIYNTILYGNTATIGGNQIYISDEGSDPNFYYCNIQGGSPAFDMNGNFYSGTYSNNIDANSLFVSPSTGSGVNFNGAIANWALQPASPCINAGNPSGTYPATDLANNPRVYGSSIDMGAYEYQGSSGISHISVLTSQISLYPNPSNGNINVTSSSSIDELKVTDMLGRLVYESKPAATNATFILNNAGVYFVTVSAGNESSTKKLVVNK